MNRNAIFFVFGLVMDLYPRSKFESQLCNSAIELFRLALSLMIVLCVSPTYELGLSDTTNHVDMVKQQYSLLPYPPVTDRQILSMKLHYGRRKTQLPFFSSPVLSLDTINHFLFDGSNDFQ